MNNEENNKDNISVNEGYKAARINDMNNAETVINEQTPVSNQENVSNSESIQLKENNNKSKKKKIDFGTVLLILLFICLFAYVMGMPYINEWVASVRKDTGLSEIERKAREIEKENEKKELTDKDEEKKEQEKLAILTCTSQITEFDTYSTITVEKFTYDSKGLVIESSKAITYKFNTQTDKYTELKNQCNENSLKYVEKKGYEIACSYNDSEVVMEDKFDLALFTTINDGMTKIEANAIYKDNIDSIKKKQETLGYTCE